MTKQFYPSEEQLQQDLDQIKSAFDDWKPGVHCEAPSEAPDEFIRNHWRICQYLAARNREGACPHPDVGIDKMNGEIVSAVRITSTLLQHDTTTNQELIACFVAHVLASVSVVIESDE